MGLADNGFGRSLFKPTPGNNSLTSLFPVYKHIYYFR